MRLSCFAVVVLGLAAVAAAVESPPEIDVAAAAGVLNPPREHHHCIHDSPVLQDMIRGDLAKGPLPVDYGTKSGHFRQQAKASLRIVISTQDLENSAKYCTQAGDQRTNFQGSTITCTSDDVLTTEKKNILLNNILPAALARLQSYYSLERVTSNIIVPQSACSGGFTIPSSHSTTGVADADYVIYVAAGQTTSGTLAWAGGCRNDASGRIVVGRANFGPKYIAWGTDSANEDQIITAVHELHHALGFSYSGYQSLTKSTTIRGKSATVLTSAKVLEKAKEYLGCSTLTGVEVEDEGGSGSKLSHWEKRIFPDEAMCASGGNKISTLTLALMEDMGFYTADYSQAGQMTFGKSAGCSYVNEKCNVDAAGKGTLWCFTSGDSCTVSMDAVGKCSISQYTSSLPTEFQYFSDSTVGGYQFYDYCPIVQGYSNRICTNSQTATSSETTLGFYFGSGGRCFSTSSLIKSGFSSSSNPGQRCLKTQCSSGVLQFQVGDSGTWYTCSSDSQVVSGISGFSGSVTCPSSVTSMCNTFSSASTTPTTTAATPGGNPTPATTATPGSGSTSVTAIPKDSGSVTVTASATISGDATVWQALLDAKVTEVDNAVRTDIANALSLLASQIRITSRKTGSLIVEFGISSLSASTTATQIESTLKTYVSNGGAMGQCSIVFGQTVTMTKASANTNAEGYCTFISPTLDNNSCFIYGGITLAGIIVVIIIVCFCCRRKRNEEGATEPAAAKPRGRAYNAPA